MADSKIIIPSHPIYVPIAHIEREEEMSNLRDALAGCREENRTLRLQVEALQKARTAVWKRHEEEREAVREWALPLVQFLGHEEDD